MEHPGSDEAARRSRPGLTACSLCSGETLGDRDPAAGGQAARLRRLQAEGLARLTFVECLDECERGDVVVARPSASARASGGPVWFERLAGDDPTGHLASWLAEGGPGVAPVPGPLAAYRIDRDGPPTGRDGGAEVGSAGVDRAE
ncbi:hypothetical protein [Actinotalea sp. K2]|uniref:hypothetical protein n=1 Tax=Actinotalea sp. K2 TaxID=2939438 RepID=UPI0020174A70|nr:hypothetical protein [Actinotalea sp. K2]MCL3862370.1 hypothetical protein [Actinotalea sp. K2]